MKPMTWWEAFTWGRQPAPPPPKPKARIDDLFVSDVGMLAELCEREGNESYVIPLRRVLDRVARMEGALSEIRAIESLSYENRVNQVLRHWEVA